MSALSRCEGYAPIGDYATLGDGRTVALVAADGRVDWWPLPTLDAPPVCAAILDPSDGGYLSLAPTEAFEATRRYVEGTNVLETRYETAAGTVLVTDALNTGAAGRLPWAELARRVDGLDGQVDMRWEFAPGNCFGQIRPWVGTSGRTPVVTVGDQTLAIIVGGTADLEVSAHRVAGSFRLRAGERSILGVVGTDHEPVVLPAAGAVDARIDATIESWRRWSEQVDYEGPWAAAVSRSALALKTLLFEPRGAIAAAATTSLPEAIGGSKNWDYRFSWVRDSSFTLDALIQLSLHEEVHAAVSWLLDALRRSAPDLHVFYTLSGSVPGEQDELDLPGYRRSRPVRSGNGAARQSQLGTYGDLFDAIWRYVGAGHVLDKDTGRLLADLADQCSNRWMTPDSGMWELPQLEHYTISKIGCWVALDRAARLAAAGQIPSQPAVRWRHEADDIKQWVSLNCWSTEKQAYTFYPGTDRLDAAVLLAGRTGFDRGSRLASTIEAVVAELSRGPLVYRYTGMATEEGAFVACTFWLVDALVRTGQTTRARELMDHAVLLANDVGILSEQVDPATGNFLGNLPQGLSHLALINAAHTLVKATKSEPVPDAASPEKPIVEVR